MNRFSSIFSQLLQLFPRVEFQDLVTRTHAERHAKGYPCWNQFVSMLFCQLGRAHSLREITGGLRSCEGKLKHLGITAPSHSTLAAVYKERWQIEIFFKALKQNLKIKTFVGTSSNAVKIQIWTALIAMLILRSLQLRSKFNWSLSNLVALLRMSLFTHRDLWEWLNKPYETPPIPYEPEQLHFCFR